ncbi:site-specific DNA-methyltransferase [Desulfoprunum benzoelyticum]|uniref:Methyltransferase n=1 Tax=Desulfoprunum benzoelyticum TaxID=1506996 RepID=A0A840UXB8_9BACT|nr:DNA methyltransferase [Desulfoprunum benzoelyticum]MBB5349573.1 DNA modification methylase [Desulfoprunum benzoelyticum]MBM9531328.1 site-specific DNA-methyltransferase [Desulfoprunum benzoelyticum]
MKVSDKSLFEETDAASQPVKKRGRPRKNAGQNTSIEVNNRVSDELPATVDPRNKLNDLTAREWIPETVSVWNQKGLGAGHPDAQIERQHPAPFSFTDVGRLIRFFTKKGHTVLDPFVGIGSTLKACAIDERHGIGIELNHDFAELSRKRLATEVRNMFSTVDGQHILEGDARDHLPTIPDESVDFVVTSPPYWSILKKEDHKVRQERLEKGLAKDYGTDTRDLAKIENYDDFLRELVAIFGECSRVLKRGRYMAIIVSDFRDKSKYIMFHSDLAQALESYGMEMRGLKVLYQRHKKVFPYGYPYSYVPNIHNQFILILQKPK